MRLLIVVVICMAFCGKGYAGDIYHCENKDGKKGFQDRPCDEKTVLVQRVTSCDEKISQISSKTLGKLASVKREGESRFNTIVSTKALNHTDEEQEVMSLIYQEMISPVDDLYNETVKIFSMITTDRKPSKKCDVAGITQFGNKAVSNYKNSLNSMLNIIEKQ